jgi:hypothetical protein
MCMLLWSMATVVLGDDEKASVENTEAPEAAHSDFDANRAHARHAPKHFRPNAVTFANFLRPRGISVRLPCPTSFCRFNIQRGQHNGSVP